MPPKKAATTTTNNKKKKKNDNDILNEAIKQSKAEAEVKASNDKIAEKLKKERENIKEAAKHILPTTQTIEKNGAKNRNTTRRERLIACGYRDDAKIPSDEKLDKRLALHLLCLAEREVCNSARENLNDQDTSTTLFSFFYNTFSVCHEQILEKMKDICGATEEECEHFKKKEEELRVRYKTKAVTMAHIFCLPVYREYVYWETQRLAAMGYTSRQEPLASALSCSSNAVFAPLDEITCEVMNRLCIVDYEPGHVGRAWLALSQPEAMHANDALLSFDYAVALPRRFDMNVSEFEKMPHDRVFLRDYKQHNKIRQVSQRSRALVPLSFAFTELRLRPPLPSMPMVCNGNRLFALQHLPEYSSIRKWREERRAKFSAAGSDAEFAQIVTRYASISRTEERLTLEHSAQAFVDEMLLIIAMEYSLSDNTFSLTEMRTWQYAGLIAEGGNGGLAVLAGKQRARGYEMTVHGAEWLLSAAFAAFVNGGYGADLSAMYLSKEPDTLKRGIDMAYEHLAYLHESHVQWFTHIKVSFTEAVAYSISNSLFRGEDGELDEAQLSMVVLAQHCKGVETKHAKQAIDFARGWQPYIFVSLLEMYAWYSRNVDDTLRIRLVQKDHDEDRRDLACWRIQRSDAFLKSYSNPLRLCALHSALREEGVTPCSNRIHLIACTLCSKRIEEKKQVSEDCCESSLPDQTELDVTMEKLGEKVEKLKELKNGLIFLKGNLLKMSHEDLQDLAKVMEKGEKVLAVGRK